LIKLLFAKQEYFDQYKLLLTTPGVAEITAIAILAEIGDVSSFLSARQLAAYIGITPKPRLSGTSVHGQSCISKIGNSTLRKALYMPALSCNQFLVQWAKKLEDRGKKGKQIIVVVMRKLIHLIYGVLKTIQDLMKIFCRSRKLCVQLVRVIHIILA
jgi:transposase